MSPKADLSGNKVTIGSWVTLAHSSIAELMARTNGFDWLVIDMEHSVIELREAQEMILAIELYGVTPLVRLTSNGEDQIKRVMDAGAHGVVIPFKRDYLLEFNRLPQSDLEKIESVDMLRVLKTGSKVRMVPMETETFSVDTPEDLQKVQQAMANDKLISRYRN